MGAANDYKYLFRCSYKKKEGVYTSRITGTDGYGERYSATNLFPASLREQYGEHCSVATAPDVPPHTLPSEAASQALSLRRPASVVQLYTVPVVVVVVVVVMHSEQYWTV